MSHNNCSDKFTEREAASGKTTGKCEACGKPASGKFCDAACYTSFRRKASAASTVDRFWSKVKIGHPTECWLWQASAIGSHGYKYGQFALNRDASGNPRNVYTHRFVCELTHGPLKDGQVAMHSCDQSLCCNPAHISPGTQAENLRDASRKGHLKVPRSTAQKITTDQLPEIDALLAAGERQVRIAERYGVSKGWVCQYAKGTRRLYDRPVARTAKRRKVA